MGKKRAEVFLTDSYCKELDATVIDHSDGGILLDKTILYPRGGGQPDDKGEIIFQEQKYKVKGLKKTKDNVEIKLSEKIPIGETVTQRIDWEYRYKLMKHHTALHILSAVVWDLFEAKVTGGTIYHNKARLDFDLEEFSNDLAEDLVEKTNEIIREDHPVSISFVSREKAESDPELIRTKVNLLPDFIQEIRLVKIGDVDIQADGGLHVKSTGEIGQIELVKTENKGKGQKRISIAVSDQ